LRAAVSLRWTQALSVWPGLIVCTVVGLAAGFLSGHYGGPQLLYALLLGLALNFLSNSDHLAAGITFTSKTLLRLGVALLGARITIEQIADLGLRTGIIVALSVVGTIACGLVLARWLGQSRSEGWIAGVSVAICGASAAMAVAAALPQTRENERYTLMTVVGVTLLSTLVMVLYPLVLDLVDLPHVQAGVFLGATIHDVAQVVAAGSLLGPDTRDTATIVKLFRVAMLAPVVVIVSILARERAAPTGNRPPIVPGFLLGFVLLVIVGSFGWMSPANREAASFASKALLVVAIAAAGMRTNLQELARLGWKPVVLLVSETVFLALLVSGLLWIGRGQW
jgi:uncharacterized integral membrane protein (TIGR00698 family)